MRAFSLPILLSVTVGCGATVEGTWVGDCEIGMGTLDQSFGLELALDAPDGDAVSGTGILSDATYGDAPIVIEGTVDGRDVELELLYDLPTLSSGSFTSDFLPSFGIEATVKGDTMDGRCSIEIMGFSFGADIELTRE